MATTKTEIVNLALTRLGEDPLLSFDDLGKAAALARLHYPLVIEQELRKYTWNFSKTQTSLSSVLPAPTWKWVLRYPRPPNFLRLISIEGDRVAKWEVMKDGIYTDISSPINIEFIEDHGNVTLYDALFVNATSLELAHRWVTPLAKSVALKTEIREEYNSAVSMAYAIDAIERESGEIDCVTWVDDR